jgi:glutathione S-transferase
MDEWTFDPVVADAILRTRKLGLKSLRETAEYAFDTRLGDADWLDGAFSAGDLLMVSVLLRLKGSGMLDEYPNLSAYVARGEARPAYTRAFDAQLAVYTAASTG